MDNVFEIIKLILKKVILNKSEYHSLESDLHILNYYSAGLSDEVIDLSKEEIFNK